VNNLSLLPTTESMLVAVPFLLMLVISMFRLDEMLAAHRSPARQRRSPCGVDACGEPILCDPDGRQARPPRGEETVRK
jgi:hypothetical protein